MTEEQVRDENQMADRIARKLLSGIYPQFPAENVPVKVAAKVFGRSEVWVRNGIRTGLLPIGVVTTAGQQLNSSVYISPKLLWEFTGYVYNPEEETNAIKNIKTPRREMCLNLNKFSDLDIYAQKAGLSVEEYVEQAIYEKIMHQIKEQ